MVSALRAADCTAEGLKSSFSAATVISSSSHAAPSRSSTSVARLPLNSLRSPREHARREGLVELAQRLAERVEVLVGAGDQLGRAVAVLLEAIGRRGAHALQGHPQRQGVVEVAEHARGVGDDVARREGVQHRGDGGGAHVIGEVLVVADDVQEVFDVLLERREPPLRDVFEVVAAHGARLGSLHNSAAASGAH
jgi:hypothetical protein